MGKKKKEEHVEEATFEELGVDPFSPGDETDSSDDGDAEVPVVLRDKESDLLDMAVANEPDEDWSEEDNAFVYGDDEDALYAELSEKINDALGAVNEAKRALKKAASRNPPLNITNHVRELREAMASVLSDTDTTA